MSGLVKGEKHGSVTDTEIMRKRRLRLLLCTALTAVLAAYICGAVYADEILHPDSIWASSTLYDGIGDYSAWNTQDNDLNTAWVEGAAGNGIGEYLAFGIPAGTTVTGIFLSPGYLKSEDLFYKNAAPTRLLVYSGSQSVTVDCSAMASKYVAYSDANWGTWDFNFPIVSDGTFRITRNDGIDAYTYDFSRDGYSRIENGAIVYTIPEQKVLFEYYTDGDYLHFHTRYEDEYYY